MGLCNTIIIYHVFLLYFGKIKRIFLNQRGEAQHCLSCAVSAPGRSGWRGPGGHGHCGGAAGPGGASRKGPPSLNHVPGSLTTEHPGRPASAEAPGSLWPAALYCDCDEASGLSCSGSCHCLFSKITLMVKRESTQNCLRLCSVKKSVALTATYLPSPRPQPPPPTITAIITETLSPAPGPCVWFLSNDWRPRFTGENKKLATAHTSLLK